MSQQFPRGIEVLLKHAAVDPKFRELLLKNPKKVAFYCELELSPVEWSMLKNMPKDQLAAIIDQIEVSEDDPVRTRRFVKTIAGSYISISLGIRPDMPKK